MKLKLDENVPVDVVDVLRQANFDAETVAEEGISGTTDEHLLGKLQQERRALITLDLDFSDIRAHPPSAYEGIIVLRPRSQGRATVVHLVQQLLPVLSSQAIAHKLWIVEPGRVRIHD